MPIESMRDITRASQSAFAPGGGFSNTAVSSVPSPVQNDWAVSGLTAFSTISATPAENSFIGGLAAGSDGQIVRIVNSSSAGLICIVGEDVASIAANRFASARNTFLLPGETVTFQYSTLISRWRLADMSLDVMVLAPSGLFVYPASGTGVSTFGQSGSATTATLSTVEPTATPGNDFLAIAKTQISNATASGSSDVRGAALRFMRGATLRRQGIFFTTSFSNTALGATGGIIVGLANSSGALTTQARNTNNSFGIGTHGGETTHRIYSRDGSAATAVDLGANFPSNSATASYDLHLLAKPTINSIAWMIRRLDTDFRAQGFLSANLPANTLGLSPRFGLMVGATATATTLQSTGFVCRDLGV